jgi:signal transduction histidine kinase/ActR/RegA family two-component response regulator
MRDSLKLKTELLVLSIGSVLPLAVFAILAVVALSDYQRSMMQQEVMGRVASAMSAIDAEVQGSIMTLQALAVSEDLEVGDLRSFHQNARRVLKTRPSWLNIGLTSVSRVQLLDVASPFGQHAPFAGDDDTFDRVLGTRKPAVGSVRAGAAVRTPSVRVRVPVFVNGTVKYVLTAPIKLAGFEELLRAQPLQRDWSIRLLDRNRAVIARIPDGPLDAPLSSNFSMALDRASQGWLRHQTPAGTDLYTSYITSSLSGWVLAFDIPASTVDGSVWRSFAIAAAGALAALASALRVGWLMARRVSTPITALAHATGAMGRGEEVDVRDVGRRAEVTLLHDTLRDASDAIRQRPALVEAEKGAVEREQVALQVSDRAKDEFIAMLSHELRNPIGALTAAIHLLKVMDAADPAFTQARDVAERQAAHLARLIDDLPDVSRIAAGKANLALERLDLAEVANRLMESWRTGGRFRAHNVTLAAQPVMIHADRARIEQILGKLLANALRFTPDGGTIMVTIERMDGQAALRVTDAGDGIDAEDLPHIFDLFAQARQGVARRKGGLGIGLAVVKRLVTLQGGTVEASTVSPGKGASFLVRIPAADTREELVTASRPSALRRVPHRRRILVIEDNDDMRAMLSLELTRGGHDVRVAPDGAVGLVLAAQFRPHVVFADLGLPGIDGYQVARQLRAQFGSELVLVAFTGYGQVEDIRQSKEAGFDTHLTKPVSVELLNQTLRNVVGRWRQERDDRADRSDSG